MLATKSAKFISGIAHFLKPNKCTRIISSRGWAESPGPGDLLGYQLPDEVVPYTERDSILYNLGVGSSLKSGQDRALQFLYENDPNFSVLPTFGTTFINGFLRQIYKNEFPLKLDFSKLFHGEHYFEVKRLLNPRGDTLTNKTTITDVIDKGKGTVIVLDVNSYDQSGAHVMFNQSLVYTTQFKKWGGQRQSDKIKPTLPTPDRAPDKSMEETTSLDQAALYRLSGDTNAFHMDLKMAERAGFARPILHGLCTYGFSVRNVIEQFCDNDTTKFKSSKLRFSSPVLPGEKIKIDMWKEKSCIHFVTTNVDTGKVCISGGHVDLVE